MITKLTEIERRRRLAAPVSLAGEGSRTLRAGFIPLVDASVLIAACGIRFCAEGRPDTRSGQGRLLGECARPARLPPVRHRPYALADACRLDARPRLQPLAHDHAFLAGARRQRDHAFDAALFARMRETAALPETASALENAQALGKGHRRLKARGEPLPTLGVTYPFSSHNYEFRYWLAAGGIDPDRDVKLVVVPPPMTSDALAAGAIDGFCVGAPWNMVASERGVGRIVAAKQDIWPSAPEKVIGMRPDWAETHPETVSRLIVALDAAARWCDRPENHDALAEALADGRYLAAPVDIIRRVLAGEFNLDDQGNRRVIDDYFTFHAGFANYPRPSQALWIYSQMIRWGQTDPLGDGDGGSGLSLPAGHLPHGAGLRRTARGSRISGSKEPRRMTASWTGRSSTRPDRRLCRQVYRQKRHAQRIGHRRNLTQPFALHKISHITRHRKAIAQIFCTNHP